MKKTALLFSPEGGNVNSVTNQLAEMLGNDKVDVIHVKNATPDDASKYDQLILLGSTVGADHWNNETIEDEWQGFFEKLGETSLDGKKVGLVGLGNSLLYPEHFADGMAHLYKQVKERGAAVFGFVDPKEDEYDFTDSEALNDDGLFCGLPIDEDNEDELTAGRLEKWIVKLQGDFEF